MGAALEGDKDHATAVALWLMIWRLMPIPIRKHPFTSTLPPNEDDILRQKVLSSALPAN